ncbi:MAG TPA: PEP/pyruvate-binding domain-containing protein [Conexibacter sp.]
MAAAVARAVLGLDDAECRDAASVGPKAAVLSRLFTRMPGSVPWGFVLTPAAADALCDPHAAEARAVERLVRARIEQRAGPFSAAAFAVRSSALEEDSRDRSYAGQYETILGVSTPEALVAAVAQCARSGSSARVAAYRRAAGASGGEGGVAVLIQEMVAAERSGVAFTANPTTGASEVVVNASYGLGDAIVSGEITPDELVLDACDRVLSARTGTKRHMVVLAAGGVTRVPVPAALREAPALTEPQLRAVAGAARRCEAELGFPVDMEWAIAGDAVHVLQARPITALVVAEGARDGGR